MSKAKTAQRGPAHSDRHDAAATAGVSTASSRCAQWTDESSPLPTTGGGWSVLWQATHASLHVEPPGRVRVFACARPPRNRPEGLTQHTVSSQACSMWASATTLSPAWLAEHCGLKCESCTTRDLSNKTAPRSCFALTLLPPQPSFVLKQLPSDEAGEPLPQRLALSKNLGLAREALLYKHLGATLGGLVPSTVYAEGSMETGHKWIIMEDLSDFVDSGEDLGACCCPFTPASRHALRPWQPEQLDAQLGDVPGARRAPRRGHGDEPHVQGVRCAACQALARPCAAVAPLAALLGLGTGPRPRAV